MITAGVYRVGSQWSSSRPLRKEILATLYPAARNNSGFQCYLRGRGNTRTLPEIAWMKLNVFGSLVEVSKDHHGWKAFYPGTGSTKRLAHDIVIPSDLDESELVDYIADLCHEWATLENNEVTRLD